MIMINVTADAVQVFQSPILVWPGSFDFYDFTLFPMVGKESEVKNDIYPCSHITCSIGDDDRYPERNDHDTCDDK